MLFPAHCPNTSLCALQYSCRNTYTIFLLTLYSHKAVRSLNLEALQSPPDTQYLVWCQRNQVWNTPHKGVACWTSPSPCHEIYVPRVVTGSFCMFGIDIWRGSIGHSIYCICMKQRRNCCCRAISVQRHRSRKVATRNDRSDARKEGCVVLGEKLQVSCRLWSTEPFLIH